MSDQVPKNTHYWMLWLTIAGLVVALIGTAQVPEVRNIACNQLNILCSARQNIIGLSALDRQVSNLDSILSVGGGGWQWLVITIASEKHRAGKFNTEQMLSFLDARCLDRSDVYRAMQSVPSPPVIWQDISLKKQTTKCQDTLIIENAGKWFFMF